MEKERNILKWENACKDFSTKMRHRTFQDLSARTDYIMEQDLRQFLVPEPLLIPKSEQATKRIRTISGDLLTYLAIHKENGLEFGMQKNACYAIIQDVPMHGPIHVHDYIEIFYVISGTFSQILLGETYTFHTGDVVITDKNCEHADILEATGSVILFLWISAAYMENLLKYSQGQSEFQRFLFHAISQKKREQSFLIFRKTDPAPASEPSGACDIAILLEHLIQEEYMEIPGSKSILEGMLVRLFYTLGKDYTLARHTDERPSQEKLLLFELEKYIRSHPADVTASLLEEKFYYHRNYYNNLLRKYRDKSLREYIQETRMKRACELLKSTNHPVKEIAREVGYDNTNFFYQLFLRHTGKKPLEYRLAINNRTVI